MIEEKRLYPLSCIKGLNSETKMKLVDSGIVLIKQLLEEEPSKLARETGIPQQTLKKVIEKAETSTFS